MDIKVHFQICPITGGIRFSSRKRYRTVFDKFLAFCEKRHIQYWHSVDANVLQKYGAELEKNNYLWRSIYLELNTLKQIVKWLIKEKYLTEIDPIKLPSSKAKGTNTYCWKNEEVAAMVAYCDQHPHLHWVRDAVVGLACTGLRISELISLRWSDVDMVDGTLQLTDETAASVKMGQERRNTKTGHSRSFPIYAALFCILQQRQHKHSRVFCGPQGGRLKQDKVRKTFIEKVLKPLAGNFPTHPGGERISGRSPSQFSALLLFHMCESSRFGANGDAVARTSQQRYGAPLLPSA